jgi:MFS family permease
MVLSIAVFISMICYTERPSTSLSSWTWKEIGESYWIDPVQHTDFFLVFVSRTFYYMGVSVQTFMLFYFRDVIHSNDPQADVAYLALLAQVAGAIVCVPMGLLSNRCGRKPLIYLSSAILIGTYLFLMLFQSRAMALIGGAIYGIGNGTYLSVDYALACDTIPSKDNAARYLGIWGVGAFIGTLLGPLLIGPALLYFGTHGSGPHEQQLDGTSVYDPLGYVSILLIGCICFAAGAITVMPVRSAK